MRTPNICDSKSESKISTILSEKKEENKSPKENIPFILSSNA
jgi:hypothetical protein